MHSQENIVVAQLSLFTEEMRYQDNAAYALLDQAATGQSIEIPSALAGLSNMYLDAGEEWKRTIDQPNEIARRERLLGNFASFAPEFAEIAQGAPRRLAGKGNHSRVFHLETIVGGQEFVAKSLEVRDFTRLEKLARVNKYVKNLRAPHTMPNFEQLFATSYSVPTVIAKKAPGLPVEDLPEADIEAITQTHIAAAAISLVQGGYEGYRLDGLGTRNMYFHPGNEGIGFTFLDYYGSKPGSLQKVKQNLGQFADLLLRAGRREGFPLECFTPDQKYNRVRLTNLLHVEVSKLLPDEPGVAARLHDRCRQLGRLCTFKD